MSNDFFNPTGGPSTGAALSSSQIRAEFISVAAGFDKLPTMTANGGRVPYINTGGTAFTSAAGFTFDGTTLTIPKLAVSDASAAASFAGGISIPAGKSVTGAGTATLSGFKSLSVGSVGNLGAISILGSTSGMVGLTTDATATKLILDKILDAGANRITAGAFYEGTAVSGMLPSATDVKLYANNTNILTGTAAGVTVTGTHTVSSLSGSGNRAVYAEADGKLRIGP